MILLLALVGLLAIVVMILRGAVDVATPETWKVPGAALRALGLLAGGLALGTYAWGLLHVAGAWLDAADGGTSSSPPPPCRDHLDEARAIQVVGYDLDVVPPGFNCELTDGTSVEIPVVPGYITPAAMVLGAVALVGLGVSTRLQSRTAVAGAKL
ncbi:hypothetical protein [Nocardioides panzhihuensis]|uniref:Uncharacterized protein n=1 Tax=Nocardioides panzhihuensis TaxID=860243 RepID=A0A7Z0DKU2_9ACTN|nr:hypothetical protein [Nocardioides panzhihuensis]NYI77250.1 hypothetical protein [Nocardioides panzhihuensis]